MDLINDAQLAGSVASQADKISSQDAFEESSGPIVYMTDNRMPAFVELRSAVIYVIYFILIMVLILILPGVRRTKLRSFFCLMTLLTVGATILLAKDGSRWLTGSVSLKNLNYGSRAHPEETISGQLVINIGLNSVNVSLTGLLDSVTRNSTDKTDNLKAEVMYNEQFSWTDPDGMIREHRDALKRGLPYPILTVTEYLSQDADGFNWSRRLRGAGHFSSMILSAALLCWTLTAVSMCVLPSLMGYLMLITGVLMMSSVGLYALLIPSMESMALRMMGGQVVEFEWGSNYVATHVIGLLTILAGLMVFVLQEQSDPCEQFTMMETERNAIDRKALSRLTYFDSRSATMDTKPASNKTINMVIGSDHRTQATCKTSYPINSVSSQSVMIPIGDIEQNFRPETK